MDDQRKLSEEVRELAQQIYNLSKHLIIGQSITSVTEREAGRLARLATELVAAVASAREAKPEKALTFVGPPMKFCDASVIGGGVHRDLVNPCNRYLNEDGTCPNAAQHVTMAGRTVRQPMSRSDGAVQYCREKVTGVGRSAGLPVTCSRFVVNGECPNAANHISAAACSGFEDDGGTVCARCFLPGSAHARGVL